MPNWPIAAGRVSYTYDAAGRIAARGGTLFQSILPAAQATTAYNADNQLTTWGAATLTYDDNGNLTSDGTNSLTWDARNRLAALGSVASFVYDGADRRQSITRSGTTVTTIYDRYSPVQEKVGGSVLADLLTGLGIDERFTRTESGTTSTFLTDLLGSTTALTNASGVIQTSYGYDPYGAATVSGSSSSNPYQFTGRNNDGTGYDYFRARYYNPAWGRFVSEDPIGLEGGSNLYAYVEDDPANSADRTGLATGDLRCEGFIGGCQNGGSYGTTAICEVSGRNVCRDCAVKLMGIGGLSGGEQNDIIKNFPPARPK